MGLFGRKPEDCASCGRRLTHRHRPKSEWGIEGRLCGACYVDKAREYHEGTATRRCSSCGEARRLTDLWEPRWQWNAEGLLCKGCFDAREEGHSRRKNYCALCGRKMGLIRYNPKPKWKVEGQLCRGCWDGQKARLG